MNNKKVLFKIKSSALGYAISFSMLIGLVCAGFLFISSTNKRIEINYEIEEHLLFNNYFSLKYGAALPSTGKKTIVHPSGDSTDIVVKQWGAYRVIVASTYNKTHSLNKSALIGYEPIIKRPVLYIPNRKQRTKLCGKTLIEGDVFSNERGFERGYVGGKRFEGDKLNVGKIYASKKYLPALNEIETSLEFYLKDANKIDLFNKDSIFSFSEKTSIISATEPLIINSSISGNIILHSFDSIYVTNNAQLENVILISPKVRFEEGFSGSVQVIASQEINCEKSVHLNYPSSLILYNPNKIKSYQLGIFLAENSRVLGGVLLFENFPDFRNPLYLEINKATIGGFVYNSGETELQGTIIGSLYTKELTLKTGGGEYKGYLLDATLSSIKLPKDFATPNWLKEEIETKPILLSCF